MSVLQTIEDVYSTYFGGNYTIPKPLQEVRDRTYLGTPIKGWVDGKEYLLPVTLWVDSTCQITIPIATVKIQNKKTVVRTPLADRIGTVKELYNLDDWKITIKGVLVNRWGNMPEEQIMLLRRIYEMQRPVELRNAYTDFFLADSKRVALLSLEFPDMEGKSIRHRSFILEAESDYISTLKV